MKAEEQIILPKKVYFVLNPEGKAFNDSVNYEKHLCKMQFVASWFGSWDIHPNIIEADTVFGMFERKGFKIVEVELPNIATYRKGL